MIAAKSDEMALPGLLKALQSPRHTPSLLAPTAPLKQKPLEWATRPQTARFSSHPLQNPQRMGHPRNQVGHPPTEEIARERPVRPQIVLSHSFQNLQRADIPPVSAARLPGTCQSF